MHLIGIPEVESDFNIIENAGIEDVYFFDYYLDRPETWWPGPDPNDYIKRMRMDKTRQRILDFMRNVGT